MQNLPSLVPLSTAPWRGPKRRKLRNLLARDNQQRQFRLAALDGQRDWARAMADHPALRGWSAAKPRYVQALKRWHALYTATVSEAMMAASLESAAFLCFAVDAVGALVVADMGSGFSSVALRVHARRRPGLQVWSVDDDAYWLDRTGAFLRRHGLNADQRLSWADFAAGQGPGLGQIDLIFHDLGNMVTRRRVLPILWQRLAATGWVILDDMHKPIYRSAAIRFSVEPPFETGASAYSLRSLTVDRFSRYAWLLCKKSCKTG